MRAAPAGLRPLVASLVVTTGLLAGPLSAQRPGDSGREAFDTARASPDTVELDDPGPRLLPSRLDEGWWSAPLPMQAADHLGDVTSSAPGTPGGRGLLPLAREEAEIAARHVRLAARDSTDLANMKRHMTHVLHALDPSEARSGPGLGYGVRRAARDMAARIEAASDVAGAPGALTFHGSFAARAARGAAGGVTEAVEVARAVERAVSALQGRQLLRRLDQAVRAVAYGTDGDGDGRIGYAMEESGLAQVGYHLELLSRVTTR